MKLLPVDYTAPEQLPAVTCRRCRNIGSLTYKAGVFECRDRQECDDRRTLRNLPEGRLL